MVSPDVVVSYLSGAWALINSTTAYLNGTAVPPNPDPAWGHAPAGIITYHPSSSGNISGYMSANIMSTDPEQRRPNVTVNANYTGSEEDWALIGKHTLSYAGPFSVLSGSNETSGSLHHGPLLMADLPSWVGTEQLRYYEVIDHDMFVVYTNVSSEGTRGVIYWKRLV